MEPDWTLVYTTTLEYEVPIIKEILADNDIEALSINKKDSAYVLIGDIEIYVPSDHALKAIQLLKDFKH
ncbi:MAG: DUF2007 domain-containing protein [Bacteroidales bacterium]|nr:DUF2007 domain-containing protein [Bacteroidales bacterium]